MPMLLTCIVLLQSHTGPCSSAWSPAFTRIPCSTEHSSHDSLPLNPGHAHAPDWRPAAAESYRGLQQRLVTNAESVAFYSGIDKEGGLIRDKFQQLVRHLQHVLGANWRHNMWQQFHMKYALN